MTYKRRILSTLTRAELLALGRTFDLKVSPRMALGELQAEVSGSKRATLDKILPELGDEGLARIARELGLDGGGAREALVGRILKTTGEPGAPGEAPVAGAEVAVAAAEVAVVSAPTAVAVPVAVEEAATTATVRLAPGDLRLEIDVEPRKPRLAWQGMDRRERVVSVPTQVVEIVRPGRAVDRGDSLLNTEGRAAAARSGEALPPNRLIWTNDNLVALKTLLEERDPVTRDYRYRGKVDLVYIDPPFMVNSDFRADNSIEVDIDEEEGMHAKKEPSLVEILAYRDTWRQGLDSFLSMLKRRLELLKDLLAQTGYLAVHVDWHTAHYVKVLLDEIFGYENFRKEIVWLRTTPKGLLTRRLASTHDVLLLYGMSEDSGWNDDAVFQSYDGGAFDEKTDEKYSLRDPDGRRYQLTSLVNPNPDRPNLTYEFLGVTRVWRWSRDRMLEAHKAGEVIQPSPGAVPRFKRYLDEQRGKPVGDVWSDLPPVNAMGSDRTGYPTQKPVALIQRVLGLGSPPGGLVLDCFLGSGTTAEAAERLGRRWIGIDNGKYAIHLARKRLIQLQGQTKPAEKPQFTFEECATCKKIDRKEKPLKSRETFAVRPFTIENMGVYQRAEQWQDFQTQRSRYRDEMIKVFGGEPVSPLPPPPRPQRQLLDPRRPPRRPGRLLPGVEHRP